MRSISCTDYVFPAESTARVIITETGVSPEELLSLAERHGVEAVQLRMTTDTMGQTGEPLATNVIEMLGHGPDNHSFHIRTPCSWRYAMLVSPFRNHNSS